MDDDDDGRFYYSLRQPPLCVSSSPIVDTNIAWITRHLDSTVNRLYTRSSREHEHVVLDSGLTVGETALLAIVRPSRNDIPVEAYGDTLLFVEELIRSIFDIELTGGMRKVFHECFPLSVFRGSGNVLRNAWSRAIKAFLSRIGVKCRRFAALNNQAFERLFKFLPKKK